jgi:hypothetical protein
MVTSLGAFGRGVASGVGVGFFALIPFPRRLSLLAVAQNRSYTNIFVENDWRVLRSFQLNLP